MHHITEQLLRVDGRIGYTGKQIRRYLAGEIPEIEALEQEPLRGSRQKYLSVDRVMNTLAT